MKSSDVQQQFLSAMRNAKFGLFRNQTGLSEILEMLGSCMFEIEAEADEIVALLDDTLLYFSDERKTTLENVRVLVRGAPNMGMFRRLNLGWLEWINSQSHRGISNLFIQSEIEHKSALYIDGSNAIIRTKGISTIKIVYDVKGELIEIINGFYWTEPISQIQELRTISFQPKTNKITSVGES